MNLGSLKVACREAGGPRGIYWDKWGTRDAENELAYFQHHEFPIRP